MRLGQPIISLSLCFGLTLSGSARLAITNKHLSTQASVPVVAKGVVVESLTKGSEAERVGLRVGDILLSWARGDVRGEIESPFELPQIETEQASRGPIKIEGLRGAEKRVWLLRSQGWGIVVRPHFSGSVLSIYLEGQRLADAGKLTEGVKLWRAGALSTQAGQDRSAGPFMLACVAQRLFWAQRWEESYDAYREAIQQATEPEPTVRAELFRQWAGALLYRDDLANAKKYYEEVLRAWRSLNMENVEVSHSLVDVGLAAWKQGDFPTAEECWRQSLAIAHKLAPHSIAMVRSLSNLGALSEDRGHLEQAEGYYYQALAIAEKFFPISPNLSLTLTNLGTVADQRGDLEGAEEYHRKALAVAEQIGSENLIADVLDRLGECILERGYPARAAKFQERALAIRQRLNPDSLAVASSLAALGRIARLQRDLAKAGEYYQRALTIAKRTTPQPPEVASLLIGAGNLMREQQNFVQAEEHYRQALAILDKADPGSVNHAATVANLATTVRHLGRPN